MQLGSSLLLGREMIGPWSPEVHATFGKARKGRMQLPARKHCRSNPGEARLPASAHQAGPPFPEDGQHWDSPARDLHGANYNEGYCTDENCPRFHPHGLLEEREPHTARQLDNVAAKFSPSCMPHSIDFVQFRNFMVLIGSARKEGSEDSLRAPLAAGTHSAVA